MLPVASLPRPDLFHQSVDPQVSGDGQRVWVDRPIRSPRGLHQSGAGEVPQRHTSMIRRERAQLGRRHTVDRDHDPFATSRAANHRSHLISQLPDPDSFHVERA